MNTLSAGMIKNPVLKKTYFSILFLFLVYISYSQELRITCTDEPLNKILITLRDNYGLMLSFDDKQLSTFKITVNKQFSSPAHAFDYLLKDLPLKYEKSAEGVYVFYSVQLKEKPKKFVIAGRITDKTNYETLPFSSILINNLSLISDSKGNFSFISATDSIFSVKISYLGYYILDTTVSKGSDYDFKLTPSVIALEKVIIIGSNVARSIQTGTSPGISRLNHKIAYFLPGNGDNSIFNLLRLQPGILAAGEQSADLMIWGSYEGQSQVIFDGFTIYGMKNFNDNISAVNPFMAKDIKLLKGGFGAEYGERVGGIVDITGMDGNKLAPSAQLCINNMTLNGMLSIPFNKKSALLLAYRQTYYELYNPVKFSSSGYGRGRQSGRADYYLIPDYRFRDINVKYSGSVRKSNYYISLYGGKDNFTYSFDQESQHKNITLDYHEQNIQFGAAAFYELTWNDKNTSAMTISYSALQTDRNHLEIIERMAGNQTTVNNNEQNNVAINEINSRIESKINITGRHAADAGVGFLYYYTDIEEGTVQSITTYDRVSLRVPYIYLQDNITLHKKLTLRPGIRANFHLLSQNVYLQPRLSAIYRINDEFRINSTIGMYNQFVAKNMTIDTSGNYKLAWLICDSKEIPVLNSQSVTFGCSYTKNDYTISLEGYLKRTGGLTRYLQTSVGKVHYEGDGKTKGLDLFIKKDFTNQTFWISYTLSKTEEHFPYFETEEYSATMHDQRHEIKLAGLVKIKSFHLSANYVFGSGLPDPEKLPEVADYAHTYSRLDAALIYNFSTRKVHLDAGISVLNVLNHENIRYSNYTLVPTDETGTVSFYAEAVPFTPTLFLKIYY
jgi:hypothetical protein